MSLFSCFVFGALLASVALILLWLAVNVLAATGRTGDSGAAGGLAPRQNRSLDEDYRNSDN